MYFKEIPKQSDRDNLGGQVRNDAKSDITTFSHRKTAHDVGQSTSCTWAFHILNHLGGIYAKNFKSFHINGCDSCTCFLPCFV